MSQLKYNSLSKDLQQQIEADFKENKLNPYRCQDSAVIRRDMTRESDQASLWRPAFVRDVEKILHLPYYNRYTDKTQVFSLYKNDDISRRGLHVQLVSRIARNIGRMLGLNLDLIEAIALGHDLGHTPFGHAGERFLDELLHNETGRLFNHNVQSARVLDRLFFRNVSLQCLDGVLCHNGEFELKEYRPAWNKTFDELDAQIELCSVEGGAAIKTMVPMTLEGCVVRICDMVAYLGKDRQDARTANLISKEQHFTTQEIGRENAQIINNITVDVIENSYGKDYIRLSEAVYRDLKTAKKENYEIIYNNEDINQQYSIIREMFSDVYYKLLDDLKKQDRESIIYRHHIDFVNRKSRHYVADSGYGFEAGGDCKTTQEHLIHQIVVDYMASMTDDYFIDLHEHLFPGSDHRLEYVSYFGDIK